MQKPVRTQNKPHVPFFQIFVIIIVTLESDQLPYLCEEDVEKAWK
jgi:hypothetical protein